MKLITCKIPDQLEEEINQLVKDGKFVSKSDLFRTALRNLIESQRGR